MQIKDGKYVLKFRVEHYYHCEENFLLARADRGGGGNFFLLHKTINCKLLKKMPFFSISIQGLPNFDRKEKFMTSKNDKNKVESDTLFRTVLRSTA